MSLSRTTIATAATIAALGVLAAVALASGGEEPTTAAPAPAAETDPPVEVRTQVMGTVAVPFAEVSANVDIRFFLNSFGGAVGYHNEWHTLRFNPDPQTGRDRLGQPKYQGTPAEDPQPGSSELDRDARLSCARGQ